MAAVVLHKLGDIYVSKQMFERAIDYFERSKNYYAKIEDEYNKNIIIEKIKSLKDNNYDSA